MEKMFYCPNCNKSDIDFVFNMERQRNEITFRNIRDGYGRPITHIVCPECGYELSGFIDSSGMYENNNQEDKLGCFEYVKGIIDGYSNGLYCDTNELLEVIRNRRKNINR